MGKYCKSINLLAVDANKQKIKNYKFLKVMNFDKIISNKRGNTILILPKTKTAQKYNQTTKHIQNASFQKDLK